MESSLARAQESAISATTRADDLQQQRDALESEVEMLTVHAVVERNRVRAVELERDELRLSTDRARMQAAANERDNEELRNKVRWPMIL